MGQDEKYHRSCSVYYRPVNLMGSIIQSPTTNKLKVISLVHFDRTMSKDCFVADSNHWASPNTGATNESGFTGLPGGLRIGSSGIFINRTSEGIWWSKTETTSGDEAWVSSLSHNSIRSSIANVNSKHDGLSVCLWCWPRAPSIFFLKPEKPLSAGQ